MNLLIFLGLGMVAASDYVGKGEVDADIALFAMLLCLSALQLSNLVLIPFVAVAMYFMHRMGCSNLDLVVFSVISLGMGFPAFLGLFLAFGAILGVSAKEGLKRQIKVVFLPFLFFGCLAADLIFFVVQT